MVKFITEKLKNQPSYLKKGDYWLAEYFGCSPKTIKGIKNSLKDIKREYVNSL